MADGLLGHPHFPGIVCMSGRARETSPLLTAMQRYARDQNTLDKGGWLSTVHERQVKNLPVSGSVNHRPAELYG